MQNTNIQTASDFNLEKINTEQLTQHLSASIEAESNVFIIGRRGLGKTQISKQVIKNLNLNEVYVNLSIMERTDFAGYPRMFGYDKTNSQEQFVEYMLPKLFQSLIYGDKKSVLLLDEADKVSSDLLAPCLEIVQDHKINGRALPNLMCCILTGNLISENGSRPPLPLLDRAEKFLLESSTDIWLRWAASPQASIHPSVFSFIQDNPNELCSNDSVGSENYSSSSPRSWHLSSKAIRFGEEHNWPTNLILEKVGAFVGKTCAIRYLAYYTHYQKLLPMVKNVFAEKDIYAQYKTLGPSEKNVVCMIVASRLANELDQHDPKKDQPECLRIIGKFFSQVEHENVVAALRSQVQLSRISAWKLLKNEHWFELLKELNSYIGAKTA